MQNITRNVQFGYIKKNQSQALDSEKSKVSSENTNPFQTKQSFNHTISQNKSRYEDEFNMTIDKRKGKK